jgi:hypothetical protein
MRPLQSIAMGLVIIALRAPVADGYDVLPDGFGWLLVVLGVRGLPDDLERRPALLTTAVLAGTVSVLLWWPGVSDAIDEVDPALLWAVNLPQLAFLALLSHVLARRAATAEDPRAAAWLRILLTGFVVAALLPVLVFGGGVDALEGPADAAAVVLLVGLIWLLFSYSVRPWAGAQETRRGPHPPKEERPS